MDTALDQINIGTVKMIDSGYRDQKNKKNPAAREACPEGKENLSTPVGSTFANHCSSLCKAGRRLLANALMIATQHMSKITYIKRFIQSSSPPGHAPRYSIATGIANHGIP